MKRATLSRDGSAKWLGLASRCPDRPWGPPSLVHNWNRWLFLPRSWVTILWRSPLASIYCRVKNAWSFTIIYPIHLQGLMLSSILSDVFQVGFRLVIFRETVIFHKELHNFYSPPNITRTFKWRRIGLAIHVALMGNKKCNSPSFLSNGYLRPLPSV
jgi:hypothetical protein